MNCCLLELFHVFICTTGSLLSLSKMSLNLRVLVYDLIKTHFIGKYLMGIKDLNVANENFFMSENYLFP